MDAPSLQCPSSHLFLTYSIVSLASFHKPYLFLWSSIWIKPKSPKSICLFQALIIVWLPFCVSVVRDWKETSDWLQLDYRLIPLYIFVFHFPWFNQCQLWELSCLVSRVAWSRTCGRKGMLIETGNKRKGRQRRKQRCNKEMGKPSHLNICKKLIIQYLPGMCTPLFPWARREDLLIIPFSQREAWSSRDV